MTEASSASEAYKASSASEASSERYPQRRRPGALGSIVITLLILGFGSVLFGYTPAIFATLYVGMFAAYVAIPYTALAIIVREVSARRGPERRRADGEPDYSAEAMRFGLFRQRASLVNAITMLTVLIVAVLLTQPWESADGSPGAGPLGSVTTLGAFALVAGAFAIIVNVPSIYSGLIAGSERHAIRQRAGAWKLILASTILTTASWIAYCGFAAVYLTATGWV
jgi:4-amino-4-deoxy-L-arabinose transferase-like glycosyltransferase